MQRPHTGNKGWVAEIHGIGITHMMPVRTQKRLCQPLAVRAIAAFAAFTMTMRVRTRMRACMRVRACTRVCARAPSAVRARARARACAHTCARARACARAQSHVRVRVRARARVHKKTAFASASPGVVVGNSIKGAMDYWTSDPR